MPERDQDDQGRLPDEGPVQLGPVCLPPGRPDLRLLVERPPRTLEAAQRLAAEQVLLADDCSEAGWDISGIAAHLLNGPIWTFWWD
jgi:hypothetical protein